MMKYIREYKKYINERYEDSDYKSAYVNKLNKELEHFDASFLKNDQAFKFLRLDFKGKFNHKAITIFANRFEADDDITKFVKKLEVIIGRLVKISETDPTFIFHQSLINYKFVNLDECITFYEWIEKVYKKFKKLGDQIKHETKFSITPSQFNNKLKVEVKLLYRKVKKFEFDLDGEFNSFHDRHNGVSFTTFTFTKPRYYAIDSNIKSQIKYYNNNELKSTDEHFNTGSYITSYYSAINQFLLSVPNDAPIFKEVMDYYTNRIIKDFNKIITGRLGNENVLNLIKVLINTIHHNVENKEFTNLITTLLANNLDLYNDATEEDYTILEPDNNFETQTGLTNYLQQEIAKKRKEKNKDKPKFL